MVPSPRPGSPGGCCPPGRRPRSSTHTDPHQTCEGGRRVVRCSRGFSVMVRPLPPGSRKWVPPGLLPRLSLQMVHPNPPSGQRIVRRRRKTSESRSNRHPTSAIGEHQRRRQLHRPPPSSPAGRTRTPCQEGPPWPRETPGRGAPPPRCSSSIPTGSPDPRNLQHLPPSRQTAPELVPRSRDPLREATSTSPPLQSRPGTPRGGGAGQGCPRKVLVCSASPREWGQASITLREPRQAEKGHAGHPAPSPRRAGPENKPRRAEGEEGAGAAEAGEKISSKN